MTLWLLMVMLCSAAAVGVSIPLIRRFDPVKQDGRDIAIYEDQLKEVDRDVRSGAISAPEAVLAKVEIQRRLAAAAKNVGIERPISSTVRGVALAVVVGLVIVGGGSLYGLLGSPDLISQPAQTPVAARPAPVEIMVAKLEARLQANPNDAEGWRTLGFAQFELKNYPKSAEAYAKALALDPGNIAYKSAYAEALVQAADSVVTPTARALFAEILAQNPKDMRARFYDALALEQAGNQIGALDRWLAVLADTPADAGWRDYVMRRVAQLGTSNGRDVSAALAAPAVEQLAVPLEKSAMIAGMIANLQAKLEANPHDRDGWAMLIRSLIVSGDRTGADGALAKALEIFKDDKVAVDGLKAVANAQ